MSEIDWSQFIPDLIIAIIGIVFASIFAGRIVYFKSERFKTWLNKLPTKFVFGLKWLVEKWYFFLPLSIVIVLGAVAFRIYGDWKITAFSLICYIIGLFSWGLSKSRQSLFRRNSKNNTRETKFLPISLPAGVGNSYLRNRYIDPPFGDVVLGGVQFQLRQDSLVFDTNEQIRYYLPHDDGGKEIEFQLTESINRVKSVHFLINSGNSKTAYINKKIGTIRLVFREAPPIDVELILGKNIREWCPGNSGEYIRETSSPATVVRAWAGMSKNGANAVIDRLKIPVYECMRDCFLEKIIFVHKSVPQPPDTMGVHFSVFGISLEIQSGT
jgi:hypothetical protein